MSNEKMKMDAVISELEAQIALQSATMGLQSDSIKQIAELIRSQAAEIAALKQAGTELCVVGGCGISASMKGAMVEARLNTSRDGVPEGWRLVPVEPTAEMIQAGRDEPLAGPDDEDAPDDYRAVYKAMLAAAPIPAPCHECNDNGLVGDAPIECRTCGDGAGIWPDHSADDGMVRVPRELLAECRKRLVDNGADSVLRGQIDAALSSGKEAT